jgi:glycine betaine/proline transport system substrate-binding protein
MKYKWTTIWIAMLCLLIGLGVYSGTQNKSVLKNKGNIVFADAGWDSLRIHNEIAGFILEKGYGYHTSVINGSTPATLTGLKNGEIDVYMEVWPNNVKELYEKMIKSGDIKEVGVNYKAKGQGFFVPTYMIKGDPEKGIKPITPDLKTVQDLKKYWKVFKDPTDPTKGRIVGAPSGWAANKIMHAKMNTYGLDKNFNYFTPGSSSALATSIVTAFKNHEPWVGYYWTPTWITAMYDLTLIKEPAYNAKIYNKNYGTAFPPDKVVIAVNSSMVKKAPEVVSFLKNYHTSNKLTEEFLAYKQKNNASNHEAAIWWLKKHKDLWTKWVPADVAKKVEAAL